MIRTVLRKGVRLFPMMVILLGLANILLTNHLASSGGELQQIDVAIDAVRQENEDLRLKIASASSLTAVAAQAESMGLTTPGKTQIVTLVPESLPVALGYPH